MSDIGDTKRGSVLVVGGGIAGMQTALDCANAGLKVYLVERQPAIGGNMARLDKTFPTNDCAMCMISPKLVEVGRHRNIEILSYSQVTRVQGAAGDFQVSVRRNSRFVDEKVCNGCGDCERECPVEIKDDFNGGLSTRKAIYRLYPQAIPNVYTIDKDTLPPPCRATCPAGVNAQGYVALIAKRKFLQALDVVRERMPFAGACGRICHHPCERNCNRAKIDEAVSVRNLKRFVADYERQLIREGKPVDRPASEIPALERVVDGEKVAIVGAGPAGLTCADDLARRGYSVTVFDANESPGGMMRSGIPAYRLPRDYLDYEIGQITDRGVRIEPSKRWGRDFTLESLRQHDFRAVFVATGAQLARKIQLDGSETPGVLYGIPFLAGVNAGTPPAVGSNIVVIGGGNVAMDVARSAVRIAPQAKVTLYCLESEKEMPAHAWEIAEAREEGVVINPSWGPRRVVAEKGAASGIEMVRCTAVFDEQRRFNPKFDESAKTVVQADTIILAVGQACDLSFVDPQITTGRGLITTDPVTLATSMPGVFAGGDVAFGPSSLVQAVAHGHRGAESIHRFLRGMDLSSDREPVERPTEFADVPAKAECSIAPRAAMPAAPAASRTTSFVEIEHGYTEEAAVAEARRCLNCGACSYCRECVRVCKAHAVHHEMQDRTVTLNVGAIVLATGYEVFDAHRKAEYGFGRFPNVLSGIQFERVLSASGPYQGHVKRPSDGATPKKIAWIQCCGSRDASIGNDYCSSVCCMYATKQAIIAREHERGVSTTIFFIDMRAFGKGFESVVTRAGKDYGVRYIRSQISSVKENPDSRNLAIRYVAPDGSRVVEEEFDIVVLSTGMTAGVSAGGIDGLDAVGRNRFGFAQGSPGSRALSAMPGVFLCGAAEGPKDIPETVMQSSAAAAQCGELLAAVRGSEVQPKKYPAELQVAELNPRIGVFICHCGTNIASVVDVKAVAEYARSLPGVVYAENTIYTCSQDTQKRMQELIKEKNLNRVVVASCTPRTHQPLFQETIREAGLNRFLFEMADIREQCSWAHQNEHDRATSKAIALVRGSVSKATLLEPLQFRTVPVTPSALVIGGGLSGMASALSLSRQGYRVALVEKQPHLGGNLLAPARGMNGFDWTQQCRRIADQVDADERISVYLDSTVEEISGFVGNFTTRLAGRSDQEIKHGVVIVATGAQEETPTGFLYGRNPGVITQRQLDARLQEGTVAAQNVVMIQCVGSRIAERPYCSRTCCGQAVNNALKILEKNPGANVTILYREMRTYGFMEEQYRRAREAGAVFIHFPDETYPVVKEVDGTMRVVVRDTVLGGDVELQPDLLVLSAATVPSIEENRRLGELLKVPLTEDGYFMEAHVKLRPVDFANEGVFLCGLAHSPKFSEENMEQALAAAARAACILSKDSLEVGGLVSEVDEDKCATCLTCVRECAYNAPFINSRGKAEIEAAKCQGCGNCAAACPAKAIQLRTFTDTQQRAIFRSILREETVACLEH